MTSTSGTSNLTDRFEIVKDIGDGSFGNVVLAKVRGAGSSIARRGTLVAIKTMKKKFESFQPCLELREVIFLKSLPAHQHLVPALDIFLDPTTKKLHICMEYMDGNLYQLMKARDHKPLDGSSVKSILYQILSGLEHIHAHGFFHRDIKPENILVSSSSSYSHDSAGTFRRYSNLVTPPATPPSYTVKIADFGLARETHSKLPYTTYVSTRWYRAPEVLLRAGEYSAPVDIWAIGAMAVEVATLKALFPGGNEVDQVWRVCEIMGSPGNWVNKSGKKIGGGEWREGTRLAQKLGFSFPKMSPVAMEKILLPPQWPASLCDFVTKCLMWDPKNRPTSVQALQHEYFIDAVDPLRPRSTTPSRILRKHSELTTRPSRESVDQPTLSSKASWFRKSFIGSSSRDAPVPSPVIVTTCAASPGRDSPNPSILPEVRQKAEKRMTWHPSRLAPSNGAPMPILPTIRPVSPLSDAVTAQAARMSRDPSQESGRTSASDKRRSIIDEKTAKKIGRQLSVQSTNNERYTNPHHAQAVASLTAGHGLSSPTGGKESFFSHLRKRARRLSGKVPVSPNSDDLEAGAGCGPWSSNRSSMIIDQSSPTTANASSSTDQKDLDRALMDVQEALEGSSTPTALGLGNGSGKHSNSSQSNSSRKNFFPPTPNASRSENSTMNNTGPISSRTRRSMGKPGPRYDTPDENDELLDEAILSAAEAVRRLNGRHSVQNTLSHNITPVRRDQPQLRHQGSNLSTTNENGVYRTGGYPTPSPQQYRHSIAQNYGGSRAVDVAKGRRKDDVQHPKWPTPPYEDNEWVTAVGAFASVGAMEARR
ncbi:kinase-like protein [Terfezia boudieri ATCC MYA-4762]|uniref:Kinase-like protein n=1 Tax=Terfezia boudieri ATCC MYA-4762 TaxID=1051890 RepID=A0A3N4LZ82_9PEZI|nr:kinase-like protein [Terfezia boudieri ATCC MYA-4762]